MFKLSTQPRGFDYHVIEEQQRQRKSNSSNSHVGDPSLTLKLKQRLRGQPSVG